ncbi:hypothetical protein KP509_1Z250700 [Ceratopteris richardii]|nr:hypothetical protein KP509_1Z250700 [Ceratopteris richardii]
MGENISFELPKVASYNGVSSSSVARIGHHHQRYEHGYRLVDRSMKNGTHHAMELLMVTTQGGPGLLFPKGGWETNETAEEAACREAYEEAEVRGHLKGYKGAWDSKSKRLQSHLSPVGLCRA